MSSLHSGLHHHYHVFSKEFKVLFFAKILHSTGLMLTHFFLPLFLFGVGKSFTIFDPLGISELQKGMMVVGGYFILQRIFVLLFNREVSEIIHRLGSRNGMIIGQVIHIACLVCYQFIAQNHFLILLAALLEGIKMPLFWSSYYTLFSNTAKYKKMGKSVGTIEFFTRLIHVMLPGVSGIIITLFGFNSLFLFGIVFQSVSLITLFFVPDTYKSNKLSLGQQLASIRLRHDHNWILSLAGRYMVDSLQSLWPFLVVFLIGSVERVGYLYSFVLFVSLICIYFAGWYIDHRKSRQPFVFSGSFLAVLWAIRAVVSSLWGIVAIDTLDKLFSSIFNPFYDSLLFRKAKGDYTLAYFVFREQVISLTALVFWGGFVIYFLFTSWWQYLMVIGFVGMLMSIRLSDQLIPEKDEPHSSV